MSKREIKILKNNHHRDWEDIQWINEFYEFLQGNIPEEITLARGHNPNLSKNKAFAIIWYLQEHFPVLPDRIDKCDVCHELYDSWSSGHYSEKQQKCFCSYCDTYENEKED